MELQLDSAVDQPILTALRTGDHRRAASLLIDSYGVVVTRICRLVCHGAEAADDLTCECFAAAFSGFSTFRATTTPHGWLREIAREGCLRHLDRLLAQQGGATAPAPPGRPASGDLAVDAETVKVGLDRLEPLERAVIGLHVIELVPPADLAARLGLAAGAAALEPVIATTLSRLAARLSPAGAEPATSTRATSAPPDYPLLIEALRATRWRMGEPLLRRLEVLAAAL